MKSAVLATGGVLLLPAAARAAGAEEGGLSTFIWSWVNLILLLAVLFYFARRPVRDYLRERRRSIESNLEESARLLADAERRLAEWRDRAARLEVEVGKIEQAARARAQVERERILADAQAAGERIRRDAELAVAQELRRARESLRREAADLAVEIASGLVRTNVSEADQVRLVDEFLGSVTEEQARRAEASR
jgi:F-type H+-transporting ATPase subunit b